MDLYTFPATSTREIQIGVDAKRWAITPSSKMKASLATKAAKIPIGARGIMYCSASKSLTTPFTFLSRPDPDRIVEGTWPGARVFPFDIEPHGAPRREMGLDQARRVLDVASQSTSTNSSNIFNLAPTLMFNPIQITETDWNTLIRNLGVD
jgi:hypothetical protein